MFSRSRRQATAFSLLLLLTAVCSPLARAQTDDFGDGAADPVKLFERGQDAHARGNLEQALEFYEEAIKVRPEFPEAEYQRAMALLSLSRTEEAQKAFRRSIELRPKWSLPWSALGALQMRLKRLDEAEKSLSRALELDAQDRMALVALTDLRLQAKAERERLEPLLALLRTATVDEDAPATLWAARGSIERALGDAKSAAASLDRAISIDSKNTSALMERAELRAASGDYEHAIEDAKAAERLTLKQQSASGSLLLANILVRAGRQDEALRTLTALEERLKRQPEVAAFIKQLESANAAETEDAAALEKLLEEQPRSAPLLARLCTLYRTENPGRALDYCRRAMEIEPRNAEYATRYAAALVQARRFTEAVVILRRVIAAAPDNYAAHSNLATALYEMKSYSDAIAEFRWLLEAKPDLTVAHFFIATAHDYMGEYEDALAAYETFLARADASVNQLEIEKVNLRVPSLRRQIKLGQGVKRKKQ